MNKHPLTPENAKIILEFIKNEDFSSAGKWLRKSFMWSKSPEGMEYWTNNCSLLSSWAKIRLDKPYGQGKISIEDLPSFRDFKKKLYDLSKAKFSPPSKPVQEEPKEDANVLPYTSGLLTCGFTNNYRLGLFGGNL